MTLPTDSSSPDAPHPRGSESMSHVTCPGCGKKVLATAVACPQCGETIFVEHPGDIHNVRQRPLDLPPAQGDSYGP